MQARIYEWIDSILQTEIPDNVVAFNFNIYEGSECSWSMDLVGTSRFDLEDEDWACDEVLFFGDEDEYFRW